jgi:hypothetical protein
MSLEGLTRIDTDDTDFKNRQLQGRQQQLQEQRRNTGVLRSSQDDDKKTKRGNGVGMGEGVSTR